MSLLLILAGLAGATAVVAGAFGAHALRATLPAPMMAVWETGATYHLIHAVALLGAALLARDEVATRPAVWAGVAFAAGIVLFSGSLYALALTGTRLLGAVTPIGGAAFILGWALIAWAGLRAG